MRYERTRVALAVMSILCVGLVIASFSPSFFSSVTTLSPFTLLNIVAVIAGVVGTYSVLILRRVNRAKKPNRVFLLYAREDLERARKLAEYLRESGYEPWLDVDQIVPGEIWRKSVLRAIEDSSVVLALFSSNSAKKGFIQEELGVALASLPRMHEDISPVVPVRLDRDAVVPEQLADIQWVDVFDSGGLERLRAGLSRIIANPRKQNA